MTGHQPDPLTRYGTGRPHSHQEAGRPVAPNTRKRATERSTSIMNALQREAKLRLAASGVYAAEAAVELLIGHRMWLRRADFTGRFIHVVPDTYPAEVAALVRWRQALEALEAGELPCSSGEAAVLGVAASIGAGMPVDLNQVADALDRPNLHLVLTAIAHAAGYRNAQVSTR